jgi:hypothetical protein
MKVRSERRLVVEVAAAFSLPLPPLAAVAGGAFLGAFDLGGGELEAGPDLIGLDLGHRPLLPLRGLPGALLHLAMECFDVLHWARKRNG